MNAGDGVLAIDLGKTWCRAALLPVPPAGPTSSPPGAAAVLPPASADVVRVAGSIGLAEDGGVAAAVQAVERALSGVEGRQPGARVVAVGIGAAGSTAAPVAARELCSALASRTGAPCAVTSDAVTSHVGALGGRPGVVLAAGTGAVAVAVRADRHAGDGGRVALVDGWGQWLGDEGSGAWIGRRGLQAALRAHDGRGPATTLCDAVLEDFGDLDQVPAALAARGPVRASAAFAPRVLEAAQQGDRVATDVVRAAAARLAETTLAAVRRCRLPGTTPVALVGGLSHAGPTLLDPWQAALSAAEADLEVVAPLGDSLSGAGLLAVRSDLLHETAVVRSDRRDATPELEDV